MLASVQNAFSGARKLAIPRNLGSPSQLAVIILFNPGEHAPVDPGQHQHGDDSLHVRCADFLWCMLCERAYRYGTAHNAGTLPGCPYRGCEHNDAEPWTWTRVRRLNPDYPDQPSQGVVYPLFGPGTYIRPRR